MGSAGTFSTLGKSGLQKSRQGPTFVHSPGFLSIVTSPIGLPPESSCIWLGACPEICYQRRTFFFREMFMIPSSCLLIPFQILIP
jgi:hypothetical protein